jgi:hypothetical protein
MGVSNEAKNVIPLKFLRKIQNNFFFPLVNSIRGHTVYVKNFFIVSICYQLVNKAKNLLFAI